MQIPQDDFNLLAWQLGQPTKAEDVPKIKAENQVSSLTVDDLEALFVLRFGIIFEYYLQKLQQ